MHVKPDIISSNLLTKLTNLQAGGWEEGPKGEGGGKAIVVGEATSV